MNKSQLDALVRHTKWEAGEQVGWPGAQVSFTSQSSWPRQAGQVCSRSSCKFPTSLLDGWPTIRGNAPENCNLRLNLVLYPLALLGVRGFPGNCQPG